MTTGQQIFDMAMVLIDEQDPRTGATDRSENSEFRVRSAGILNLLMQEVCPLDAEWTRARERGASPRIVTGLENPLDMSDRVSRGLLPYGLAGLLVLEENPACAQCFLSKYASLKEEFRRGAGACIERVVDRYGGIRV